MLNTPKNNRSFVVARRLCLSTLGILSCAAMIAHPTLAQTTTDTWVSGVTGNWSTGADWVGGLAPTSSNTTALTFNSTTNTPYTATNDIANSFALNSLTLNNTNATPTNGLITLAGESLAFGGTAPTVNLNGSGNALINNAVSFTATSVIGGSGTGTLTFGGTVDTGTSPTTINNLSVDNANGTYNFAGITTLNALTPGSSSDYEGGSFFATNGIVNVSNSLTANNLFYVGDSISSVNLSNGSGATSLETSHATLNINNGGLVTQNGRFAIGAFTNDTGVVNVNSGGTLNIFDGDSSAGGNRFAGRLQIGGSGSNGTNTGTANATPNAALLNIAGGNVSAHNVVVLYTNGAITESAGANLFAASIADGSTTASAASVNGISLANSNLYLQGVGAGNVFTFSGPITSSDGSGTASQIFKQGTYGQILAGTSSYGGKLYVQGGTLTLSGSMTGTNLVTTVASQDGTAGDAILSVTGTLGGVTTLVGVPSAGTPGTLNISGSGSVTSTTTLLVDGAINVSGNGSIGGATTNITGGTLTLSGTSSINSTNLNAGGGTVSIGSGTNVNSTTTTITGNSLVSDSGSINSSSTVVASGILSVNSGATASTSGAVTVQASGGTLSGNGTVGNIALTAGVVSPGSVAGGNGVGSIGTLTGNSLTWTCGAAMNYDLNLSSDSSDTLDLTTYFDNANTANTSGFLFNFTTTGTFTGSSETFDLVHFATGQTNFTASDFTANGVPAGFTGVFTVTNNDLFFGLDALPEPSALMLLLGGGTTALGTLTARRLCKKKSA